MILSKREKWVLYATLAVACAAAVNFLFLAPFEAGMAEIDKREKSLLEKKKKLLEFVKKEPVFRRKIEEVESIIPRSSAEKMSNEFQVHIRELAQKANLQVTDNKYLDKTTILEKYMKMAFAIRFECDIKQLRDYLYYLETSPRLLKISQLDIVQEGKSGETLSVNMRLSTLVQAE